MPQSDLLICLSLLAVFVVLVVVQHARAGRVLSRWAMREKLRIVCSEKRYTRSPAGIDRDNSFSGSASWTRSA